MARRLLGRPKVPVCFLCSDKVKKHHRRYHIPVDWVRLNKEGPKLNFRDNFIIHSSCNRDTSPKQLEKALKLHIKSIL